MTKIFGTAMGENSAGLLRRAPRSCRDTAQRRWGPLWAHGLHSLAGPLPTPAGNDAHRMQCTSAVARQRLPVAPPSAAASPGVERPACAGFDSTWYADFVAVRWRGAEHQSVPDEVYVCKARVLRYCRRCGPGCRGHDEVPVDSCHFFLFPEFVSNVTAALFTIDVVNMVPFMSARVSVTLQ